MHDGGKAKGTDRSLWNTNTRCGHEWEALPCGQRSEALQESTSARTQKSKLFSEEKARLDVWVSCLQSWWSFSSSAPCGWNVSVWWKPISATLKMNYQGIAIRLKPQPNATIIFSPPLTTQGLLFNRRTEDGKAPMDWFLTLRSREHFLRSFLNNIKLNILDSVKEYQLFSAFFYLGFKAFLFDSDRNYWSVLFPRTGFKISKDMFQVEAKCWSNVLLYRNWWIAKQKQIKRFGLTVSS